jgi:hypothetical protein
MGIILEVKKIQIIQKHEEVNWKNQSIIENVQIVEILNIIPEVIIYYMQHRIIVYVIPVQITNMKKRGRM